LLAREKLHVTPSKSESSPPIDEKGVCLFVLLTDNYKMPKGSKFCGRKYSDKYKTKNATKTKTNFSKWSSTC
jgi:hypothetical protein